MRTHFCLSGLTMLLLSFIGGMERAHAGVYDDCAAWWHFDYDANTNGLAEASEIRDQRDWGTTNAPGSTGKHATAAYGPLGAPAWTNSVISPAGGDTYGGMSMLFNPITNATQAFPDTFKVGGGLLLTNGTATIVTRFRWDGFAFNSANPGWIYNNGLDWTPKTGWMFGVREGNQLGMYVGNENVKLTTTTVATNVWYDAAAVLTDNGINDTVEFYLWSTNSGFFYQKVSCTSVTNAASSSVGTIIGAEASSSGYASGNALKSFKGAVNHLAVWDRALTYAEVMQAFGYPQPRFQIGLKNNSLTDLGPESQTAPNYMSGAPWYTLRRAVTATYSDASLKIPLAAHQKLNYVLHVRTLTDSGTSAGLSLIVNGVTNLTQTAELGKDLYWYIASSALTTGTNTFTLHYETGTSAYVGFDWLELGGAWQVGYDNGSTSEFVLESSAGDHFYVTDPNWMHVERALTYNDTNTVLHFFLSDELAKKYYYTYTTRIIGQGPSSLTNYAFSVEINGEYTQSFPAQTNGTYISVPFDRSHNKSGENTINVMYNGPMTTAEGGGYLQFDFHRLSVAEAPKGTLIRLR